LGCGWLLVFH
ncbi:MSHA biogenesis MshN domain protein, partial [Vibrio parahaemolyticus V-223/04]